jgi:UDP-N-acetylmuramoyl-tripeptide--D-alanyl-D-alanine ligase
MATPIPQNRARFLLDEVAFATGGTIVQRGTHASEPACGAFTDSRACCTDSLFVALRGQAHDGHAFVATAVEKGARIVVVERGRGRGIAQAASVVEVEDTLAAWGALAGAWLRRWRSLSPRHRVVAITGSSGKTTTKELTAALLCAIAPTHKTAGNLNNRIGVPAVLLGLEDQHRFCVLEVGMSLPGEIEAIGQFASPDVAVIVNVGVAHSEGVGGREGVMHEKGALYRALGPSGIAIVNCDDAYVCRAADLANVAHVIAFGRKGAEPEAPGVPRAGYVLVHRVPDGGGARLTIDAHGRSLDVSFPLPGEAAAIDLTAALAAQEALTGERLDAAVIERALLPLRLEGRASVRTLRSDVLVLDDSYNANPSSMRASLATLREIAGSRRKVAVLGEMKELGALAEAEHDSLGDAIAEAGIALVIGCGGLMDRALERASAHGVEVEPCRDTAAAVARACDLVRAGDAVLVKGSRSTGTERVVDALSKLPP